ncbi:hypothetical protein CRG98_026354 [Punica granatum]|uniref:CCHC-type domain-containing protein n=1 Tax=Punica granatum TaxID=22663 RepID=A0A2I0JAE1_PUNGR|nr:hypothetical protein CRG98_026354 [Punica granatum]
MSEGTDVRTHVQRMIRLIRQLEKLEFYMDKGLHVDLVFQSLLNSLSGFIVNFHMNKLSCSLLELLNMLVTAQNAITSERKDKEVAFVADASSNKIGKKKKKSNKGSIPPSSTGVSKNIGKVKVATYKRTCFYCGKNGHWKRNCPQYLISLKVNEGKKPLEGKMTGTPFVGQMGGLKKFYNSYVVIIPSKSVSTTPYEMWNGRTHSLKHVKIWGCPTFIKKRKTNKLETLSEKVPQTDQAPIPMDTNKLVETPTQIENVTEPRRSGMVTRPLTIYLNLHENVQELFVHRDNDYRDDSTTYEETITDIDSSTDSVSKNQVWDLVDPHEGIVPIENKWVFKRKIGADGKVETYKARLAATGNRQRQGVDYEETFSHVAMLKSIRTLLARADNSYRVVSCLNGHVSSKS